MSADQKRTQIKAYFFPYQKPRTPEQGSEAQGFVLIGVLILLFGIAIIGSGDVGAGILVGLVGVGIIRAGMERSSKESLEQTQHEDALERYRQRLEDWGLTDSDLANPPSGEQIDIWLQEDLDKLTEDALNHKLGLVRNQLKRDPLIIYGPLFWETYGIPDEELVYVREKTTNILRFSCYRIVIVFLTDARVATYSCNFNFLRNARLGEKTVEYLYQDIVSVSTEEISTNYTLPDGKTLQRAKVFRLTVPSDRIEVVVNSPQLKDMLDGTLNLGDPDKNVRVIREMLRAKKG